MINIIPRPSSCTVLKGQFVITNNTAATFDVEFKNAKAAFDKLCKDSLGYKLKKGTQILFEKVADLGEEEYTLAVTPEQIKVGAATDKGAFYAVQSLRQAALLDICVGEAKVPCFEIKDAPRFGWRALLLDEARHFFGTETVKKLLDMMAFCKLNVLHWHLTDDQGWRIEIKKYPLLTEISSKRKDTHIHGWKGSDMTGEPYEGFYTQEQIKEIVDYAQSLNISIVPEIDMPAHFRAVFAAYPQFACVEKESEVPWYFGSPAGIKGAREDCYRIACAGKEETYQFIFDVLDEICEMFPAPYFHIGGDEAPKKAWKECPHCQAKMKENNLKDEEALQGYLNNRVAEYLKTKNKRLIGWNEILKTDNLDHSVIGQYWTTQRDKNAVNWANNGCNLVLSKHEAFYFDMCYSLYPLANTYKFEPKQLGITKQGEQNVLGLEGAMWTEWVDCKEKLEVSLYPRMQALSEVAWTPSSGRNLACFIDRWHALRPIFDKYDVFYAEDGVAMPVNPIRRLRDIRRWFKCDQHMDVKLNHKLKERRLEEERFNAEAEEEAEPCDNADTKA